MRSCNLDTWLPKQVDLCKALGNAKANAYWEARLPRDFRRPPSGTPTPELVNFIRDKYQHRRYAALDVEPPTIENYLTHPYCAAPKIPQQPQPVQAPTPAPAAAAPAAAAPAAPLPSQPAASQPASLPPRPLAVQSPLDMLAAFDATFPMPSSASAPALVPSSSTGASGLGAVSSTFDPFAGPAPVAAAAASRASDEWTDFAAAPGPALTRQLSSQPSGGHGRSHSAVDMLSPTPWQDFSSAQTPASSADPLSAGGAGSSGLLGGMQGLHLGSSQASSTSGATPANGDAGAPLKAPAVSNLIVSHRNPGSRSADEILKLFDQQPSLSVGSDGDFGDFVSGVATQPSLSQASQHAMALHQVPQPAAAPVARDPFAF